MIKVYENSAVGMLIFTLSAEDADVNPELVYQMISVSIFDPYQIPLVVNASLEDMEKSRHKQILDWFELNVETGEIRLASSTTDVNIF